MKNYQTISMALLAASLLMSACHATRQADESIATTSAVASSDGLIPAVRIDEAKPKSIGSATVTRTALSGIGEENGRPLLRKCF